MNEWYLYTRQAADLLASFFAHELESAFLGRVDAVAARIRPALLVRPAALRVRLPHVESVSKGLVHRVRDESAESIDAEQYIIV